MEPFYEQQSGLFFQKIKWRPSHRLFRKIVRDRKENQTQPVCACSSCMSSRRSEKDVIPSNHHDDLGSEGTGQQQD